MIPGTEHISFSARELVRRAIANPEEVFPRIRTDDGMVEEYTHWQARAAISTMLSLSVTSPSFAQAIEARRAETVKQDSVADESAVPKGFAQGVAMNNNPPNPTPAMIEAGIAAWEEPEARTVEQQIARIYLAMRAADQPPPNTGLTDVELEDVFFDALYDSLGLMGVATRKGAKACVAALAAMPQQPVHADEVEQIADELRAALDPPEAAASRLNPDYLGELVRVAWVKWAEKQPNPKSSWLVPYRDLSEPDKEADRQIGVALARIGAAAFASEHRFLFKRILAALLVSNRSGVEDLKHDLDRYMKIANIECNEAERLREALARAEEFLRRLADGDAMVMAETVEEEANALRTALDTENSEDHMSREG